MGESGEEVPVPPGCHEWVGAGLADKVHQVGELITVLFLLGNTFCRKSDGATDLQTLFKYKNVTKYKYGKNWGKL